MRKNKKVEKIKIKSGDLKNNEYNMLSSEDGLYYIPRDSTYPLSSDGKILKSKTEKIK